ncbi:MAG: hypothetical protein M3Q36_00160 [bacterium]|nr:hypothetical protein [bacterium]
MKMLNLVKSKKHIIAPFVVFFLLILFINGDTKRTALKYCVYDRGGTQYCDKYLQAESEQLSFSANPKHFFMSDMAFRNIFSLMGFSTGTMSTFSTEFRTWPSHKNGSPQDKSQYYKDEQSRISLVYDYRKRLVLYFVLFIIVETLLLENLYNKLKIRKKS